MSDPSDAAARAEALKDKGNEEYKAGNYHLAVRYYTQAIELDSENKAFYTNRAAAYMMLKQYEDAVKDCKRAIELDNKFVKAYSRCSKALLAMVRGGGGGGGMARTRGLRLTRGVLRCARVQQRVRVLQCCTVAPRLQGDFREAGHMLSMQLAVDPRANAHVSRERQIVVETQRQAQRAYEAVASGHFALALRTADAALEHSPACSPLRLARLEALLGVGRASEAYAQSAELMRGEPSVPLMLLRAKCLYHQVRVLRAACCVLCAALCMLRSARCVLHAAFCMLRSARCLLLAACCLLRADRGPSVCACAPQANLSLAKKHLQEALRSDPDNSELQQLFKAVRQVERLKEEGNQAFRGGDLARAIDVYEQCLAVEPGSAQLRSQVHCNRAAAFAKCVRAALGDRTSARDGRRVQAAQARGGGARVRSCHRSGPGVHQGARAAA